jgi:hypothetical protein
MPAMAFEVHVTIRDGRAGREGGKAGVNPSGKGAILETQEKEFPRYRVGDRMTLRDGTEVVVIGQEQDIRPQDQVWGQTVVVGNLPRQTQ